MKPIPDTEEPIVLRTDFSNDAVWNSICATIREPVGELEFTANVDFISDEDFDGTTAEEVLDLVPVEHAHGFIIIVDQATIEHGDHPLVVMDLLDNPGRCFRAIPGSIQTVENNLSIGNMCITDFAEAVDVDGVFRGFEGAVEEEDDEEQGEDW